MWQALLPFLLLALLLAAPRRGGRAASTAARRGALLVVAWGVLALLIGALWNGGGWVVLLEWMSRGGR